MIFSEYSQAIRSQFSEHFEPNKLDDIVWYRNYEKNGQSGGAPILLSLGENWEGPSKSLRELAIDAPAYLDGYQFSLWGEPNLVDALRDWFPKEYGLKQLQLTNKKYRVACCWSGTRGALFDLGRKLGKKRFGDGLVFAAPGYDYGNVMSTGGLVARPVTVLTAENCAVHYEKLLSALDETVAAIVLNVQHNPLAHQIPSTILNKIFHQCLHFGIVPVFDEAHFSLIEPGHERVCGLKLWLDVLDKADCDAEWYLVRSFGKQLNCNGWGVGIIAAPEEQLEQWVLGFRTEREYSIQASRQWAIGHYLRKNSEAVDTKLLNERVACNRHKLRNELPDITALDLQICTSFSWVRLPDNLDREEIMYQTGVLLGGLAPSPSSSNYEFRSFARIYMGLHPDLFAVAIERLKKFICHG